MTDLQVLVFQTIIHDIIAGTVIGLLLGFAIVVLRRN